MRYLPLTSSDRAEMLKKIGVSSTQELYSAVPSEVMLSGLLNLPKHKTEMEVEAFFKATSKKNLSPSNAISLLGGGMYTHHIPASVDYIIQRGEFLTSYTPYQPEVSQGTLQCLFEFQTQVSMLTGMPVANASMYDGSTAMSEAIAMALRVNSKRKKVVIGGGVHPHYTEVSKTHAKFLGWDLNILKEDIKGAENLNEYLTEDIACLVVQTPDFFGNIHDYTNISKLCKEKGILLIVVVTEVLSLGLLKSPGEMGADIVVGEGQSLGNPTSFGGPSLGLFATKMDYIRQMPGRICGETKDKDGKRGYVLTLSAREQHIRREKATSNICTNSGLCALAFSVHATLLGEKGIKKLAKLNHYKAVKLAKELSKIKNVSVLNKYFFNEFTVELPINANNFVEKMVNRKILAGVPLSKFYDNQENKLLVAVTETTTDKDIDTISQVFNEVL